MGLTMSDTPDITPGSVGRHPYFHSDRKPTARRKAYAQKALEQPHAMPVTPTARDYQRDQREDAPVGEGPRQEQLDLADPLGAAPAASDQPVQGGLFPDDSLPDELVGYRGPSACQIAGITYRQLDYWARTSLVVPSIRSAAGSGSQRLYSFKDILVLKIVKRLLDTGISLHNIRVAVDHLRQRGVSDLANITLFSDGTTVYECTSAEEVVRSEEHTSELQSRGHLVCRLLLEKIKGSLLALSYLRLLLSSSLLAPWRSLPFPTRRSSDLDRQTAARHRHLAAQHPGGGRSPASARRVGPGQHHLVLRRHHRL